MMDTEVPSLYRPLDCSDWRDQSMVHCQQKRRYDNNRYNLCGLAPSTAPWTTTTQTKRNEKRNPIFNKKDDLCMVVLISS